MLPTAPTKPSTSLPKPVTDVAYPRRTSGRRAERRAILTTMLNVSVADQEEVHLLTGVCRLPFMVLRILVIQQITTSHTKLRERGMELQRISTGSCFKMSSRDASHRLHSLKAMIARRAIRSLPPCRTCLQHRPCPSRLAMPPRQGESSTAGGSQPDLRQLSQRFRGISTTTARAAVKPSERLSNGDKKINMEHFPPERIR